MAQLSIFLLVLSVVGPLSALPAPQRPSCPQACSWCNNVAAPRLRVLASFCPNCECSAQFTNGTCPVLPKPDRLCTQGQARDINGCPLSHCAALPSLLPFLQRCPKSCPGGFQVDPRNGQPRCECSCPLERLGPIQRTLECAKRCHGFQFRALFNPQTGCTECQCGAPFPTAFCPPLDRCPLSCPLGYALGPRSCPVCRCRESPHCPKRSPCELARLACPSGPHRSPFTGCISEPCRCEAPEAPFCPIVGCPKNCGPHREAAVLSAGCRVGCRCECRLPNCPEAPACLEPELDEFGCPTCGCRRFKEDAKQKTALCPGQPPCNIKCPSGLRQLAPSGDCEVCSCCPDVFKSCPNLPCKTFATDQAGCPLCACAEAADMPGRPILPPIEEPLGPEAGDIVPAPQRDLPVIIDEESPLQPVYPIPDEQEQIGAQPEEPHPRIELGEPGERHPLEPETEPLRPEGPHREHPAEPRHGPIEEPLRPEGPRREHPAEPRHGPIEEPLHPEGPHREHAAEPRHGPIEEPLRPEGPHREHPAEPRHGPIEEPLRPEESHREHPAEPRRHPDGQPPVLPEPNLGENPQNLPRPVGPHPESPLASRPEGNHPPAPHHQGPPR